MSTDLIRKAQEMLVDAQSPEDFFDAARALTMHSLLTMRLANNAEVKQRLLKVLQELESIQREITDNTVMDSNISNESGGGVWDNDNDITSQIWPKILDD